VGLALFGAPAALALGNDPSPAQAIAELNAWRAQVGEEPVSSADVATWDQGCADHNQYEQDNGTLTHFENSSLPGYTPLGDTAGPDSVLAESVSAPNPTPEAALLPATTWDSAVFHRVAVLEPRLANIGFNATTFQSGSTYRSWACLWDQNMNSNDEPPTALDDTRTTPSLALYPSPANGATYVPTVFPAGTETPNPATETGVPAGATLGWLLNVEINGPWPDGGGGGIVWADVTSASLENDATRATVPIVVSQCGDTPCSASGTTCAAPSTALGCYFGGGFGILPLEALSPDTTYHVSATGTVTNDTNPGSPVPYPFTESWCFSTGPTYTASTDCHAAAPGTGGSEAGAWPLNVSVTGDGSVAGDGLSCPGTCSEGLSNGSVVTLTETPAAGRKFLGWSSGACSGTSNTCELVAYATASVAAAFSGSTAPGGSGHAGPPTISGESLSIPKHGGRLAFTVHAGSGGPAIKSLAVSLPHGLSFATKSSSVKKGVHGSGRFKAKVRSGTLTLSFNPATGRFKVTVARPEFMVRKSVAGKHGLHLTIVVRVIDTTGKTTTIRLPFTFH
jgi:hypothetical protein